jgi:hypothetical protein
MADNHEIAALVQRILAAHPEHADDEIATLREAHIRTKHPEFWRRTEVAERTGSGAALGDEWFRLIETDAELEKIMRRIAMAELRKHADEGRWSTKH